MAAHVRLWEMRANSGAEGLRKIRELRTEGLGIELLLPEGLGLRGSRFTCFRLEGFGLCDWEFRA